MVNSLSLYRYSCFALFTLCNAVICCVSVWNLALTQQLGFFPQVDAYLIAVTALAIIYIFPVMCVDQFRKNALSSRVWFECIWVGVFLVLELAGAAAATATLPDMTCNFATALFIPGTCTTTKIVLAFTWINTIILIAYFCLLMVSAIIHLKDDSQIWGANVRTYPWFQLNESLPSAGPSPVRTTWSKAPLPSAAPQIRLPSEFGSRMVKSGTLRSSTMKSAAMKSSAFRTSTFDSEKQAYTPQHGHGKENANPMLSALPPTTSKKTPLTANKSAKILQSAWISATVTPASPPSDDSYGSSSSGSPRSDLTSTPTGLPPSAMYVPFSSTIKPSPLNPNAPPPRSSSLSATFKHADGQQQPPLSAVLTPSRMASLRGAGAAAPSPKAKTSAAATTGGPKKSKRKSNRPPPLDMTRLHSTYGR